MRNNYLVNTWLINLAVIITALLPGWAMSQADSTADWMFAGHTKYQYIHTSIPNDSVLQSISGDSLQDHNLEVRLMAAARRGFWNLDVHLQFITVYSDSLAGLRDQPRIIFPGADVINDDRRWFNLTLELNNEDKNATLLRLDRASVAYTGRKTVIRFGRQAISWGNGLLFTPMDIFNPFDPSAVDKEYKSGDDMLYGQYLLDNGNDLQAVAVVRRHLSSGEVEKDESSMAVKYHGFLAGHEYDLLLAEHYGERVFGLGASTDYGGAVWRCDLVWTDTDSGSVFSALGSASYSWVAGEHNWSGVLEYYYNGFGQADGDYSTASLADNPALLQRLARGELFNLGRHYLGAAVSVEITPLLNLSSNTFVNIADPSALAQLVLAYDWKQDLQLLAALNFPVGPNGSEYGGIATEQSDLFASTGVSLFAQLAWYF